MNIKIHKTADVQSTKIGRNTQVWQFSIILPSAMIGENCNINCHVFIENDVIVGNNVTIKTGVQLWDGLRVGDDVFIGPNVTFTNDRFPRSKNRLDTFPRTLIERGASIGGGAIILPGTTIGCYSLIGAGSVVTKDIQPYTVWVGSPAKQVAYVTKNGKVLDNELKDNDGILYKIKDGEPQKVEKNR